LAPNPETLSFHSCVEGGFRGFSCAQKSSCAGFTKLVVDVDVGVVFVVVVVVVFVVVVGGIYRGLSIDARLASLASRNAMLFKNLHVQDLRSLLLMLLFLLLLLGVHTGDFPLMQDWLHWLLAMQCSFSNFSSRSS
jgi:hypothetical protein